MSEKEPYDRSAHDILFHNVLGLISSRQEGKLTEVQQQRLSSYNFTDAEINLLEAYDKHYSSYLRNYLLIVRSERISQTHKSLDEYSYLIVNKAKAEIQHCKETLAYLEARSEMQDILDRFRKPHEDIQLTFATEYFDKIEKEAEEKHKENRNFVIVMVILAAIIVGISLFSYFITQA
jgi:hypothetical protein